MAAAARAVHAGGAVLATDAAQDDDRFARSAALERRAMEINAAYGIVGDAEEPLTLVNSSLAASRRRMAEELRLDRTGAIDAVARALPQPGEKPLVLAAGAMHAFPAFWLDVLEGAGARPIPVVVNRNPVAIAQLARADRTQTLRQTIFAWHRLTIEVLSARAADTLVLDSPRLDVATLGLGLTSATDSPAPPRHPRDEADLANWPIFSDQSRDLFRLLNAWRTLDGKARTSAIAGLGQRYDDAVMLTGVARIVTRATPAEPEARPIAERMPPRLPSARPPLLFHYHIFKNAGTSVDRMLRANFGERWADREFSDVPARRHASIREFLEARPEVQAFSSHTAPLPPPDLPGREVFPILFVRHPLLRVRSAYAFERKQDAATRGALLAKETDLRGYITTFLDDPKARQVRNFQSVRFAAGTPGRPGQELERALETLARLPFVGLVEAYDESVERLGELIRPLFPDFRAVALHENATTGDRPASTEDQLDRLRDELGQPLFDRLVDANRCDLDLFDRVRARYPTAR